MMLGGEGADKCRGKLSTTVVKASGHTYTSVAGSHQSVYLLGKEGE